MKAFDGLKVLTAFFFSLSSSLCLSLLCVCVSVCVWPDLSPPSSPVMSGFYPDAAVATTTFSFSLPPLPLNHHLRQQQQLQAQHLSHGHGPPVPLTPHPSGLQPPGIPPLGGSAGLLALSSALSGQSHLAMKDDKKHHDAEHHRGERPGKPD